MQQNFENTEDWAKLKNTYGSMNKQQKVEFKALLREFHTTSKEVFALKIATFLNVVEMGQLLDIWLKIANLFKIDYKTQGENPKGEFNMETPLGKIKLINMNTEHFMELSFSSLALTRKLLGNDITFPQKIPPKIFKEIVEDHNANMRENNEFQLNSLTGDAKIKVLEDKCIVFLSTQTLLRDFLARIYLNLRLNNETT